MKEPRDREMKGISDKKQGSVENKECTTKNNEEKKAGSCLSSDEKSKNRDIGGEIENQKNYVKNGNVANKDIQFYLSLDLDHHNSGKMKDAIKNTGNTENPQNTYCNEPSTNNIDDYDSDSGAIYKTEDCMTEMGINLNSENQSKEQTQNLGTNTDADSNKNCTKEVDKNSSAEATKEMIDIDTFLVRSGECSTYQFHIVIKIMLLTFPLSYPVFIFYFISYDPSWIDVKNVTYHIKEDNSRCSLNRTDWDYDYDKTTLTTEYDLICDKSWILSLCGSVVFIGWGIGSFIIGYLSDIYGRKMVMLPLIFLDLFCLFLHAFIKSIWGIIFVRFLMGIFHAGPAINSFILLVELIGPNYRVLATNVGGIVWGVGTSFLALQAYLIDDWRTLCLVASAPYFILILIGFWFPESVRWLNANGRTEEAEKILHRAAAINKRPVPNVSIISSDVSNKRVSYFDLFSTWSIAKSTLSQGYIWLNNGMVYYTFSWAFADLGGGDLYLNFVLGALVELPMHAVAIVCLESFGRKTTSWMALLVVSLSCISIVFLVLVHEFEVIKLIFGLVGKSAISLSFMYSYMWTSELYPTIVRTQGLGFSVITSRIGAAISPFVNNLDLVHPVLPYLIMTISSILSMLLCFILPETLGKPTRETMDDMNK